ncbi:MAG TPA: hypothetical protein DEQ09_03895, partial [Bacteroidales bacterium]|nr:hypothetical protein [Bacteroidales bacterium]
MYKRTGISLLIYILVQSFILGQAETYTIKKTSFSSDRYNEFCPVYYKEGLVFISNRNASSFFNYSNTGNNGVFNMFYTRKTTEGEWLSPELLSKNLMTRYNDGPVSFSQGNDTIYYSRNLHVEGKLRNNANLRNKLGIFYATGDDDWENTREMRINNEWYNTTTPYLSPDGKRLYFASDDPEGYGGMDLYYIDWKGNYWSGDPVNLGPAINTKGNEAYPFINESGELLFASDGHGGLGGKDIFFSRMSGNEWLKPVHIDAPINSVDNDFGIVTDPLMNEGYFSSDRDGTVDIYHFNTMVPQIFYSNIQKENQYCFIFSDSGSVVIDRNKLEYRWNFKNGDTFIGSEVEYCFPGPGDFSIKLDIIDIATGRIFCNKLRSNISLRDIEQPYINCPYASIKGESVECDGLRSYLPGYEILEFKWNFGDGTWADGPAVTHTYTKSGSYEINLTLGVKSISSDDIMRTGVSKNIEIFDDSRSKLEFEEKQNEIISEP